MMHRGIEGAAIISALALFFSSSPALPETPQTSASPQFEFRGHRIGEEIGPMFPYWNQGYRGLNLPYCSQQRDGTGVVECEDTSIPENSIRQKKLGDAVVDGLFYTFLDGMLIGMRLDFKPLNHSKIRDMAVGKWGNPSREYTSDVQNRAGAHFGNVISEWQFREGVLRLEKYFGRVDSSVLLFYNRGAEDVISARRAKANQQSGRSAF